MYQLDFCKFHQQPGWLNPTPSKEPIWPLFTHICPMCNLFLSLFFPSFCCTDSPCHLAAQLAGARDTANRAQGGTASWPRACSFPLVCALAVRQMLTCLSCTKHGPCSAAQSRLCVPVISLLCFLLDTAFKTSSAVVILSLIV